MKRWLFFLFLTAFFPATVDAAGANVLFILDSSGSMWGQVEGRYKIAIAKQVMGRLISELPDHARVGLQTYGHRSKGDCRDIELLVPLGADNRRALIDRIDALKPKGKTPITAAFERAEAQLRGLEEETSVVLVSDGKETCGGDPCRLVRELRGRDVKVRIHVVGFDVDRDEREQLACIAEAGGGKYFSADNTAQLRTALQSVKREIAETKPAAAAPGPKATTRKLKISGQRPGVLEVPKALLGASLVKQGSSRGRMLSRTTNKVAPGSYRLIYQHIDFQIDGIVVHPGATTKLENRYFGWIEKPKNLGSVTLVDQQNGRKIRASRSQTRKRVPAGTYRLRSPFAEMDNINVDANQTVVLEW